MRPFSLFAALLGVCFFQNHAFSQWSVGGSAGMSGTFRSWEIHAPDLNQSLHYDPAPGLNIYLLAGRAFGSVFALRAEAGYQWWRTRMDVTVTDANGGETAGRMTESLHSWSGALLAKISPLRGKSLYLLAGPGISNITRSVTCLDKKFADITEVRKVSKSPEEASLEPLRFCVHVGAGTDFRCGTRGRLTLEGRYQWVPGNLSSMPEVVTARMSQVAVQVGYLYAL